MRFWFDLERSGHEALSERSLVSATSTGAVETRSTSSLWWQALVALGVVGIAFALAPSPEDDADKQILDSAIEAYRDGRVEEAKEMLLQRFGDRVNEKVGKRLSIKDIDRDKTIEVLHEELDDELKALAEGKSSLKTQAFLSRIATASTKRLAEARASEKQAVNADDAVSKARELVRQSLVLDAEGTSESKRQAAAKRLAAEELLTKEVYAPLVKKARFAILKSGVGEVVADSIAGDAVAEMVATGKIRKDLTSLVQLDSKKIVRKLYGEVRNGISKARGYVETMAAVRGNESDEALLKRLGYDASTGKSIVVPQKYEEYLKLLNDEVLAPSEDTERLKKQREENARKLATETRFPRTDLGVRYVRGQDYDRKFAALVSSGISPVEASRRALERVELEKESILDSTGMNVAVFLKGTNTPFVDPSTNKPDVMFIPRAKVRQARVVSGEDVIKGGEEEVSGFGEMGATAASQITPTASRAAGAEDIVALSGAMRVVAGSRQKMPKMADADEAAIGRAITDVDLVETIFHEARTFGEKKMTDEAVYKKIKDEQTAEIAKRVFGSFPTPDQVKKVGKVFNGMIKRAEDTLLNERIEGRPLVEEYVVYPKVVVRPKTGTPYLVERTTGAMRLYPIRTQEAVILRLKELNDAAVELSRQGKMDEALKAQQRAQQMVNNNKQWLGSGFVQREANRLARKKQEDRSKSVRAESIRVAREFQKGSIPYSADPAVAARQRSWVEFWASKEA